MGYNVSYEREEGISKKILKNQQILGILNNDLKPKLIQKSTGLKMYITICHWDWIISTV